MSIRDSHHRGISFENTTQCLPTQHRLGRSGSRGTRWISRSVSGFPLQEKAKEIGCGRCPRDLA